MTSFFQPKPLIFAEAGGTPELPPNTKSSFNKGIENGAHFISTHLRITKDKNIVISEENNITISENRSGLISKYTLKELKELDFAYNFKYNEKTSFRGKGIRILSLEELLREFPDQKFSFQIMDKNQSIAYKYIKIIKKMNAEERVIVTSNFSKPVKIIRKNLQDSRTAFPLINIIGFYTLIKTGLISFKKTFNHDAIFVHEMIGTSFIANQGFLEMARRKNIRVYIKEADTEVQVKRLLSTGADGFATRDVKRLKEILANLD